MIAASLMIQSGVYNGMDCWRILFRGPQDVCAGTDEQACYCAILPSIYWLMGSKPDRLALDFPSALDG